MQWKLLHQLELEKTDDGGCTLLLIMQYASYNSSEVNHKKNEFGIVISRDEVLVVLSDMSLLVVLSKLNGFG